MKVDIERFDCYNLFQGFKFMKSVVKVLKKVFRTEKFNVDFHNKFIKFGLFCFFYFSSSCRI